jgi:N-methylhydantoinase A
MGGTFVDCVACGPAGIAAGKALTTRPDPIPGILAALEHAAAEAGIDVDELLARSSDLAHGTTLGLNAVLTQVGGRVGVITTKGHEDALLIGRVHQKVAGLRPHELMRTSELRKPDPLVARSFIRGIDERIDAGGVEIVALDEAGVLVAAGGLVADGCDALAITFLWSFRNPAHERRAAEIIRDAYPDLPLVRSSDVAPILGEYERAAATAVNAFLLKPFSGYLGRLTGVLRERGFKGHVWVMGMTGGLIPAASAATRPLDTLRSGPVGGLVASGQIGQRFGRVDLIATDMGGTSFDVGLVVDGTPELADVAIVARLHLAIPSFDIRSIGAGGGSIAWLDEQDGLHVGPGSAGSEPGPASYGRGGTEPTVTDADLLLGRLNPNAILGGEIRLDRDAAEAAIAALARRLGVSVIDAADGIVRVADAQMADLVRAITLERGYDPTRFVLTAFGGAGPLHVGRFAADTGVVEAVVSPLASVLSAFGLATAEYRRTYRRSCRSVAPLDGTVLSATFDEIMAVAADDFAATDLDGPMVVRRWVELRYRRQTHQLRVPWALDLDGEEAFDRLVGDFERLYEGRYGPGTGYAAAGIEATAVGVAVTVERSKARAEVARDVPVGAVDARPDGHRPVFFGRWVQETPIYRGAGLEPGAVIAGPAVVDWPATTLVIHPEQEASVAPSGDVILRFDRGPTR